MKKNSFKVRKNSFKMIVFIAFLIVVIAILIFNRFCTYTTPLLVSYTEIKMNDYLENVASNYQKLITETENLELLKVKENVKGEIIGMDYDLNKIYTISAHLTEYLNNHLKNYDELSSDLKKDFKTSESSILFLIPFGQLLNNVYFSQIGPKIPVIINLENSVFTNVSTKVTDYGLNNALLNVVLEVKLGYQIITPLQEEKKTLEYELLISSSVIEGKVPNFYGGSMESKSTFFEVYFPH